MKQEMHRDQKKGTGCGKTRQSDRTCADFWKVWWSVCWKKAAENRAGQVQAIKACAESQKTGWDGERERDNGHLKSPTVRLSGSAISKLHLPVLPRCSKQTPLSLSAHLLLPLHVSHHCRHFLIISGHFKKIIYLQTCVFDPVYVSLIYFLM